MEAGKVYKLEVQEKEVRLTGILTMEILNRLVGMARFHHRATVVRVQSGEQGEVVFLATNCGWDASSLAEAVWSFLTNALEDSEILAGVNQLLRKSSPAGIRA